MKLLAAAVGVWLVIAREDAAASGERLSKKPLESIKIEINLVEGDLVTSRPGQLGERP
jgi:hypothetical protein